MGRADQLSIRVVRGSLVLQGHHGRIRITSRFALDQIGHQRRQGVRCRQAIFRSVTTVSFSLITEITPRLSSARSVLPRVQIAFAVREIIVW